MTAIEQFVSRLSRIGVRVELASNYPWVYLRSVNGKPVHEKFMAEHGFTAFFQPISVQSKFVRFSDRRTVFKKIRELVREDAHVDG